VNQSQPTVTQALATLVTRLGHRLFDRQPSGVAPTPAGTMFVARVEWAIAHVSRGPSRRAVGSAFLSRTPADDDAAARLSRGIIARPGSRMRRTLEAMFAERAKPERRIECASILVIRGMLLAGE